MGSVRVFLRMHFGRGAGGAVRPAAAAAVAALGLAAAEVRVGVSPAVLALVSCVAMAVEACAAWGSPVAARELAAVEALPVPRLRALAAFGAATLAHGAAAKLVPVLLLAGAVARPGAGAVLLAALAGLLCGAAAFALAGLAAETRMRRGAMARRRRRTPRLRGGAAAYLVRAALARRACLANGAALVAVAALMPTVLGALPAAMGVPLGCAVLSVNTPLATLLSADRATALQVAALPGQGCAFFVPYGAVLFAAFAAADAVFLASWAFQVGPLPPGCVPVGLAYPLLAAAGSATLERAFPLTGWNTEPDLWRHPRKYLVPGALALLAPLAGLLAGLS